MSHLFGRIFPLWISTRTLLVLPFNESQMSHSSVSSLIIRRFKNDDYVVKLQSSKHQQEELFRASIIRKVIYAKLPSHLPSTWTEGSSGQSGPWEKHYVGWLLLIALDVFSLRPSSIPFRISFLQSNKTRKLFRISFIYVIKEKKLKKAHNDESHSSADSVDLIKSFPLGYTCVECQCLSLITFDDFFCTLRGYLHESN